LLAVLATGGPADRAYLDDVRARLATARDCAPLFDSTAFTRDLEKLYVDIAG